MSIIEQAAKRLEELNRAGIDVPRSPVGPANDESPPDSPTPLRQPTAGTQHRARLTRPNAVTPAPERVVEVADAGAGDVEPRVDVVLDLARLEREGHLVPVDTRTVLAEEFRQIKRPLLKNARSRQAVARRLGFIAVTSAVPGEGKTFSAINLAMSIATEIDLSVLLVDADVVRRDAMCRLGIEAEAGLLDLLADDSLRLDDVVLRTNVPKLSVLPAGRRRHLSTEFLASAAMDELIRKLASEYPRQVVIFDAPPLLATSEARVLATRVGQVVLVVEASATERSIVQQAFAAVEQCPIVMAVLNKTTSRSSGDGYGYGYGYGYGQGA